MRYFYFVTLQDCRQEWVPSLFVNKLHAPLATKIKWEGQVPRMNIIACYMRTNFKPVSRLCNVDDCVPGVVCLWFSIEIIFCVCIPGLILFTALFYCIFLATAVLLYIFYANDVSMSGCNSDIHNNSFSLAGWAVHLTWSDALSVSVCLDVNQDGTSRNCCTQRLVILHTQTCWWTLIAHQKIDHPDLHC